MRYKLLLCDGNNLFWRATVKTLKDLQDTENQKIYTYSILNALSRIKSIRNMYGLNGHKLYVIFDNPMSGINFRKTINSEYKHPRELKYIPQALYKSLEIFQSILRAYDNDMYLSMSDSVEADDLVWPILDRYKQQDDTVLLISADLDWARELSPTIHWYNWMEIYDPKRFKEKYGLDVVKNSNVITMYKTIHGDSSDNIKNAVPHMPSELLTFVVENYKTPKDLLKQMWKDDKIPLQWKKKIKEAEFQILTNYKCVDYIQVNNIDDFVFSCEENIKTLRTWFKILDLPFENKMFIQGEDNFFKKKST